MKFNELRNLNNQEKETLKAIFDGITNSLKHLSFSKVLDIVKYIPNMCKLHYESIENKKLRDSNIKKFHPVKLKRGEIYNAMITEGIGSELSGNHLVIVMQTKAGNIYGEKVNVLPIEGDGNRINPKYQLQLSNEDLEDGKLDKNPSRIIISDITTIDKARIDRRIGKIKPEKLSEISKKLKVQLDL